PCSWLMNRAGEAPNTSTGLPTMRLATLSAISNVGRMPRQSDDTGRVSGAAGRELVQQRLHQEINDGSMPPGFRLVEEELADRYGVSRGSVRQGLDTLISEGLVERIPNRGARVRVVSVADAVEIMECRMVLDGLLSRRAAELATDADIADIRDNYQSM